MLFGTSSWRTWSPLLSVMHNCSGRFIWKLLMTVICFWPLMWIFLSSAGIFFSVPSGWAQLSCYFPKMCLCHLNWICTLLLSTICQRATGSTEMFWLAKKLHCLLTRTLKRCCLLVLCSQTLTRFIWNSWYCNSKYVWKTPIQMNSQQK